MLGNFARSLVSKSASTGRKFFSNSPLKQNFIRTGRSREIFLDSEKFKATGSYMIYKSKDLMKMRLIFLGSLGFGSYHLYSYFFGKDQEFDSAANRLFAFLAIMTITWLGWKAKRTLKSLEILKDGKTLLLKHYTLFGFSQRIY